MTTKRPYADPASKRRNVTVNDENWARLKQIGRGNASEGIRVLLREVEAHKELYGAQTTTTNQNAVKGGESES